MPKINITKNRAIALGPLKKEHSPHALSNKEEFIFSCETIIQEVTGYKPKEKTWRMTEEAKNIFIKTNSSLGIVDAQKISLVYSQHSDVCSAISCGAYDHSFTNGKKYCFCRQCMGKEEITECNYKPHDSGTVNLFLRNNDEKVVEFMADKSNFESFPSSTRPNCGFKFNEFSLLDDGSIKIKIGQISEKQEGTCTVIFAETLGEITINEDFSLSIIDSQKEAEKSLLYYLSMGNTHYAKEIVSGYENINQLISHSNIATHLNEMMNYGVSCPKTYLFRDLLALLITVPHTRHLFANGLYCNVEFILSKGYIEGTYYRKIFLEKFENTLMSEKGFFIPKFAVEKLKHINLTLKTVFDLNELFHIYEMTEEEFDDLIENHEFLFMFNIHNINKAIMAGSTYSTLIKKLDQCKNVLNQEKVLETLVNDPTAEIEKELLDEPEQADVQAVFAIKMMQQVSILKEGTKIERSRVVPLETVEELNAAINEMYENKAKVLDNILAGKSILVKCILFTKKDGPKMSAYGLINKKIPYSRKPTLNRFVFLRGSDSKLGDYEKRSVRALNRSQFDAIF